MRTVFAAILMTLLTAPSAQAGDAAAGKKKSMMCAACHGPNGIAIVPGAPNLAGQAEMYFSKALRDFKSGARKNENMTVVAGSLSDQDIADLAAYYASFKISVESPK